MKDRNKESYQIRVGIDELISLGANLGIKSILVGQRKRNIEIEWSPSHLY